MPDKKKLSIFTPFYYPHMGGIEQFSMNLAHCLGRDYGFKVRIITFNTENSFKEDIINGTPVYRLPALLAIKGRFPVPRLNRIFIRAFTLLLREKSDYYVINTRFFLSSIMGVIMARKHRKPLILIEHGSGHFRYGNSIMNALGELYEHAISRITGGYSDYAYGVSEAGSRWLAHFDIQSNGVLYNGVDISNNDHDGDEFAREYQINPDELVISFAGRIIREKGIVELLAAFKQLSSERSDVRLVIAGSGNLLESLKQEYARVPGILFTGKLDSGNLHSLFELTDIFIHPSSYPEGLPTVILEAALHKCAIIATPQGGTIEIIPDESHGILLEEPTAQNIYIALTGLISDKQKRNLLARKIYDRVFETFDRKKCTIQLLERLNLIDDSSTVNTGVST